MIRVIPSWLRNLLTTPTAELNRWQATAQFFIDLCIHGAQQLRRDRAQQMAAALSYRTIFSMVPLLVVSLVIMNWVFGEQALHGPLEDMFRYFGLDQITLSGLADPAAPAADPTQADGGDGSQQLSVGEALLGMVGKAEDLHMGTIGLVGLAILVYAALSLLVQVESSFNVVYAAPSGRSWARRFTQYWSLVTLGPFLLIASFNVQSRFMEKVSEISNGEIVVGTVGFAATVCISWLLLVLAYITVPNTRVHLRPALVGSFIAAILWESSKYAFTLYVGNLTGYGQLYGSLALLPLFMLWVYLTWLIVLFGLEMSYTLQTLGGRRERLAESKKPKGPLIVDPASILDVARIVAAGFARGEKVTAPTIAQELALPISTVDLMLARLGAVGMVHQIDGTEEDASYALAKPADMIAVSNVLAAGFALTGDLADEDGASAGLVRTLREAQIATAGNQTLRALAAEDDAGTT
ncbi:MAG: YihY/virulence factor BrkB family protein [Phycisphaerales bacterium]|nr:YihY/virulence factor BrkB family protein [Phycisphaerales bacterium]